MNRKIVNWVFGCVAAVAATGTLVLAFDDFGCSGESLKARRAAILACWTLLPPVYFWFDWVFLCRDQQQTEREVSKHTHDLSRNIWLGLVAVLAALWKFGP
jgi:hypothetical protein